MKKSNKTTKRRNLPYKRRTRTHKKKGGTFLNTLFHGAHDLYQTNKCRIKGKVFVKGDRCWEAGFFRKGDGGCCVGGKKRSRLYKRKTRKL